MMAAAVGDTLVEGEALLRVHGARTPLPEDALRRAVRLGRELRELTRRRSRERGSIGKSNVVGRDATRANLAYASCLSGDLQRARRLSEEAICLARELAHLPSTMNALVYKGLVEIERNDLQNLVADAETLLRLSQQHGMEMFVAWSRIYLSWAHARLGDARQGAAELRESLAAFTSQGNQLGVPGYLVLLAELEADAGNAEGALTLIANGLAMAQEGGQHYADSFLHRLRGDIILKRDPANPAPAEEAYRTAIVIAKQQAARGYELRAALALAKLYQLTARPEEAHAVLAPALGGFAPAPEMPEIAEAQALLAALAETEEVKVDARQRRRLTQLQTDYGNALLQARGYSAPETTEAFARARESASGDKDAPGRLAADYGLWVGSYVRGDLPSMREHAAAFLRDVEARPDSPEASVAQRAAGATCWFAGEYRQARDHFERALALFQPGRDDDMAFRFGQDPGIAAMTNLAIASWPLGEIDRAMSLIDAMETRMSGVPHIATLSFGRMHAALFELMRGDHARGAPHAIELARLARQHELPMWGAFGVFLQGWATSASGAIGAGLDDMRQAVDSLHAQNVVLFDGFLKIALAQAEASAGDLDRALAILDEGVATADRMGHRAFESELHRARGDILLKQKPANSAPVEEALLTAIAVAKQQGTRSFELRAALALAKLYQSTGRPAEAHAVLAPALEGFAPTKAMPEIAEAHALLAALDNAGVNLAAGLSTGS